MTRFLTSPVWRNTRWAAAGFGVAVFIDDLAAGRFWNALLTFSGVVVLVWTLVADIADDGAGA